MVLFFARMRRRLEQLRRAARCTPCSAGCKAYSIGLLIGALVAAIPLVVLIILWLRSNSGHMQTSKKIF